MISDAELKRLAYDWNADPMIVDLDYVLGAFLSQLYLQEGGSQITLQGRDLPEEVLFPRISFLRRSRLYSRR
jgi:hypothetical protein